MVDEVVLGNVMVDCDDERKLQRFYGELLGWEMCELFARPAVSSSSGIVFLFIEEKDYVPPVWPEDTGKHCFHLIQLSLHDFEGPSIPRNP